MIIVASDKVLALSNVQINEQSIMQIQIDSRTPNSIMSYDESQLVINHVSYKNSLIVSAHDRLSPWPVHSLLELTETNLIPMIQLKPELILIGHPNLGQHPPVLILEWLSKQRIGLEYMLIGAACRTFNVLLSEGRACVAGFILNQRHD